MSDSTPDYGDFARPIVTIDIVLMTLHEQRLHVALARRMAEPFAGEPALLGGYVRTEQDRDAPTAVARVLRDKAGLTGVYAEQLQSFTGRERDPRGWSVSIAYIALLPSERIGKAASQLLLRPADAPGPLPFDHGHIISVARERLRTKGAYSTLPARLLPEQFTLPEMQAIYEAVIGERLDQSSFRRKIMELGAVEPVDGHMRRSSTIRRPAQLYRLAAPIALFERRI